MASLEALQIEIDEKIRAALVELNDRVVFLEALLRLFAKFADEFEGAGHFGDQWPLGAHPMRMAAKNDATVGDLRRARAALLQEP